VVAADDAGATGRAALLGVVVGESCAFVGNAIDVGRTVPHHPAAEERAIPDADVIAPEDQDVGFFRGHGLFLQVRGGAQNLRVAAELVSGTKGVSMPIMSPCRRPET